VHSKGGGMNSEPRNETIRKLMSLSQSQQKNLLKKNPRLKHFFVSFLVDNVELQFLSVRAFKSSRIYSSEDLPMLRYRSSGTTDNLKSVVLLDAQSVALSMQDANYGFLQVLETLGVSNQHAWILNSFVPTVPQWPESSLAAMVCGFRAPKVNFLDASKAEPFESFKCQITGMTKAIVFGTSLHHLQFISHSFKDTNADFEKIEHLIVFDTGGTKTKTTDLNPEQMHSILSKGYQNFCKKLSVCSEFGMCELNNQAYAIDNLRQFYCNPNLFPFVLDEQTKQLSHGNSTGLLGFGDLANTSTYCLILTEDLAQSFGKNGFKWIGRTPDSSLKGCSLNVSMDFAFDQKISDLVAASAQVESSIETSENLLFAADLEFSLKEIHSHLEDLKKLRIDNTIAVRRQLTIVASGNSAVAILYPLAWAFGYGAKEVTIKIPSIRSQDPFSSATRRAFVSLIDKLNNLFTGMHISSTNELNLPTKDSGILAFGTDATLELLRKKINSQQGTLESAFPFAGFGHCNNAKHLQSQPDCSSAALEASVFLGRGCLTPVAVIAHSETHYEEFCEQFFQEFFLRNKEFTNRIEPSIQPSYLTHLTCEIEFLVGEKVPLRMDSRTKAVVFDMRSLKKIPDSLPFEKAGGGIAFALNPTQCKEVQHLLVFENSFPTLHDPHNGQSWAVTLKRLLH
jgi:hypothetical protein